MSTPERNVMPPNQIGMPGIGRESQGIQAPSLEDMMQQLDTGVQAPNIDQRVDSNLGKMMAGTAARPQQSPAQAQQQAPQQSNVPGFQTGGTVQQAQDENGGGLPILSDIVGAMQELITGMPEAIKSFIGEIPNFGGSKSPAAEAQKRIIPASRMTGRPSAVAAPGVTQDPLMKGLSGIGGQYVQNANQTNDMVTNSMATSQQRPQTGMGISQIMQTPPPQSTPKWKTLPSTQTTTPQSTPKWTTLPSTQTTTLPNNNLSLGTLSSKYETSGRGPGMISSGRGDKGGMSYGSYQLASQAGSLNGYLKSSKFGPQFAGLKPNSPAFRQKWKQLAASNPKAFHADQHNYIKRSHFDPMRARANKLGIPNTNAVNQVLWSTSVQHGPGWKGIKRAWRPGMSESQFIKNVYSQRSGQFSNSRYYNSTPGRRRVRSGVLNRFRNEQRDALRLIGSRPSMAAPKMNVPKMKVPKVKIPKVKAPKISSKGGGLGGLLGGLFG